MEATSPNIRKLENLVLYWLALVGMGFSFSVYHAVTHMYAWFYFGAAITFFAVHVTRNIFLTIEEEKDMAIMLEEEQQKKISQYYK